MNFQGYLSDLRVKLGFNKLSQPNLMKASTRRLVLSYNGSGFLLKYPFTKTENTLATA